LTTLEIEEASRMAFLLPSGESRKAQETGFHPPYVLNVFRSF
jgi:hypothetical protein